MVRTAEGAAIHQGVLGIGHSRHRVDLRGLQRLAAGHVRQNRGQTACQHGLAAAGRANQKDIVSACGGDLQGPLDILLSHDLGEIRQLTILR